MTTTDLRTLIGILDQALTDPGPADQPVPDPPEERPIVITQTCSIEGCEKPKRARGWCQTHYGGWRRTGNPLNLRFSTSPESLAAFIEDVEWMLETGEHAERIAARLRTNVHAVASRLRRAGRSDLATPFAVCATGLRKKQQRTVAA